MTEEQIRQSAPKLMPFQWEAFNGDSYTAEKFLALKKNFAITTIIETGTCFASSTLWMVNYFDSVVTFENNKKYFDIARARLNGSDNVDCMLLDSVTGLSLVLPALRNENLMLFLDAHWLGNCPLLDELKVVADNKLKPVIVIHDFKVPDHPELGFDVYGDIVFEWDYIKDGIEKIYGVDSYTVEYNDKAVGAKRGVIFCYPK